MIIINADDWGRSQTETDAALRCYRSRRITSVTAMVFMEDSERAADIAKQEEMDVGLHLNLTQSYSDSIQIDSEAKNYHDNVVRFLTSSKFACLMYHPALAKAFQYNFQSQFDEFVRLYGKPPTHIDGHHHQHLCTNMLLGRIIPAGLKVRRSFYFWANEKNYANRAYREFVASLLQKRHKTTDYFFALSQSLHIERMSKILKLAETENVEIMTHPANSKEYLYLMDHVFKNNLSRLKRGSYSSL
jgi:predicted glycoside hydrolase/deacetylase ChbG (UPF0249 family)